MMGAHLSMSAFRWARRVQGAAGATVNIVWDPPWGPERMTEEARLELNL